MKCGLQSNDLFIYFSINYIFYLLNKIFIINNKTYFYYTLFILKYLIYNYSIIRIFAYVF